MKQLYKWIQAMVLVSSLFGGGDITINLLTINLNSAPLSSYTTVSDMGENTNQSK